MSDAVTTTIDLIRHGEPVGGRKYRGQIDDPLSDKGWAQMREAVGDHCPWDVIISSTLSRCLDFARELGQRSGIDMKAESRLVEIGFGEWEGRTAGELEQEEPGQVQRFLKDPLNNTPPGAETLREFETSSLIIKPRGMALSISSETPSSTFIFMLRPSSLCE